MIIAIFNEKNQNISGLFTWQANFKYDFNDLLNKAT